jgi:hypothetical protein
LQPANEVIPSIPTLIAEAIQRAMSINADDRFSSVEQFHREVASSAEQSSPGFLPDMPSIELPPPAPVVPQEAATNLGSTRPSIELPPPAPVVPAPQQADTSHSGELDSLQPAASRQADEEPALVPVPKKPRAARIGKAGVLIVVFALLISLGAGTGFWFHARSLPATHTTTLTPTVMLSSPTPISIATPVPSLYPTLAGTYSGTIFDISANVSANMFLTGVRQNQSNISGYLTLRPDIQHSGPFRGTVDAMKHFQFIVTDATGNARLFFEGAMQSATTLSGDYYNCSPTGLLQGNRCSRAPGSFGIWNVVLT